MSQFYILENKIPKPITDVLEWAKMLKDIEKRTVKKDKIGTVNISTVFLGIDHNWSFHGQPILFETMIFGGSHDNYQERYATWDEAEEGHKRAIELVKQEYN